MSEIREVKGREILDSRGNPTVEVEIHLASGIIGRASVPAGASTGSYEAREWRDGDKRRYRGLGVRKAVEHIEEIIFPELEGMDARCQLSVDRTMLSLDGTPNKEKLGANAILAVSLAVARAAAREEGIPLFRYLGGFNAKTIPVPMMNLFNGGRHSDAPVAVQEFMIRPVGAESMAEALEMGAGVFSALKALLKERRLSTAVGDEGGFASALSGGTEAVLDLLMLAVKEAGMTPGKEIRFALDCAASEYFREGCYDSRIFEGEQGTRRDREAQIAYWEKLLSAYPLDSLEDPMAEDDWEGWRILTDRLKDRCQLVGDDLFVTDVKRLLQGAEKGVANAILIKPNQIGTLTECFDAMEYARNLGYRPVVSHRSGETEDTFIADIAVAANAGQIKTGSLCRGERTAKYNRLLRIEEALGAEALFGI